MVSMLYHLIKAEHKRLGLPLVSALAVLGVSWLVIGFRHLDQRMIQLLVERYLPLSGLFLLFPLLQPEDRPAIKELLATKWLGLERIFITRLMVRITWSMILLAIYLFAMTQANEMSFLMALTHSLAIAIVVAGVGLMSAVLSHQLILGYLTAFLIMIIQWFSRPEQLGWFYLSTWQAEQAPRDLGFFLLGLSLIVIAFWIWRRGATRPGQ